MLAILGTIGGVFGLNPLGKAAKAAGGVALLLVLVVLLFGAKSCYDSSVVESHTARQDAANAKADRKADQQAAEQRRTDDTRAATEAAELQKVTNDATLTPANRRVARQRCIRLQQSARAAGRQPPACG